MRNLTGAHRWALAGATVLLLAACVFALGLPGGFILDDFANLEGLRRIGGSPLQAALYLADAPTGFPGRPISYLTFILQHASWPRHPEHFKLVNIAIHLLNGAIAYALLQRLFRLREGNPSFAVALLAATLWVLHPIQISSVLYVVQRMAELSTLFCFLALLAYVKGRSLALRGETRAGWGWMSAAIVVGGALGVLAKENGALLPLFVAVIEYTLLASVPRPRYWSAWAAVFLAAPVLALAAYLAAGPASPSAYALHGFTLEQRLYTEARILWDYAAKIALPHPSRFGIYFDDYPIAASPGSSLATLAAAGGWLAVLGGAFAIRRRWPYIAFGALWFIAGHLLESSIVPLELYFEHRNYLPLLGPAVSVAWLCGRLWRGASAKKVRHAYLLLGGAALAGLAAVTAVQARLWSDPIRLTVVWAQEHPASMRAQIDLSDAYLAARQFRDAEATLSRVEALAPQEGQFPLMRVVLACEWDKASLPSAAEVAGKLQASPMRPGMINVLDSLVDRVEDGHCPRIDAVYVRTLVMGLLANPGARGSYRRGLLVERARLFAVERNLDGAVRSLEAADEVGPSLVSVRLQAAWLVSAELPDAALAAVSRAQSDPRWHAWQRVLYKPIFDRWAREVKRAGRRS